jgi:hypothetical protein
MGRPRVRYIPVQPRRKIMLRGALHFVITSLFVLVCATGAFAANVTHVLQTPGVV